MQPPRPSTLHPLQHPLTLLLSPLSLSCQTSKRRVQFPKSLTEGSERRGWVWDVFQDGGGGRKREHGWFSCSEPWCLIHAPHVPLVCRARTGFQWLVRECSKERGAKPLPLAKVTQKERSVWMRVSVKGRERGGERQRDCVLLQWLSHFLYSPLSVLSLMLQKKRKKPLPHRHH